MSDTTSRLALPFPESADPADVPADLQALADRLDLIAAFDAQGLLADRPAAGTRGRYYYATNTGQLFRDTGGAWVEIQVGSITKADLATDALNAFLKLASAGDRKVAFGSGGGFAFNAPGDEYDVDFNHGLSATPVFAVAIQAPSTHTSLGVRMTCHVSIADGTKIRVAGRCTSQPIAPTVSVPAFWLAIA